MNAALWSTQALLAAVFLASGIFKLAWRKERLVTSGQTGVQTLSQPTIRFIAVSELLGAAGVVLPWATGVLSVLTPLAALCLGLVMVLAAIVHARQREYANVAVNFVLLAACLFVACGRLAR